jgi:CheY-like chemotaxis protein
MPKPMLTPKPNILLIEDNPINVMVIKKFLETDYNVDVITSGKRLATILLETTYRLILTDINLNDNDMNGVDVLKHIRQQTNTTHTPVIAVTAYHLPDDLARFRDYGFTDFIVKPVNKESLLATVKKYLV